MILLMVVLLLALSVLSATRDVSRSRLPGMGPSTTTAPGSPEPRRTPTTAPAPKPDPVAPPPRKVETATLPSPRPVDVRPGERVVLRVEARVPEILAVEALGVRAPVGPGTGGTLDLVADRAGRFPITLGIQGRRVGELRVRG